MAASRRQFIAGTIGASLLAAEAQPRGFVKANRKELIDPAGRPLHLRGINLGNWLEPEGYMFLFEGGPQSTREIEAFFDELIGPEAAADFWRQYRRRYITEADIKFIKQSGLNSVRLPFHYKFFLPGAERFELVDAAVDWCRRAGLWVILDMHCAPGGQTGANIDDSWNYPWLYESQKAQEQTCELWHNIANHYRDEPAVVGYDLLNEPIPHYPRLQQYNDRLEPIYRRITRVIREVDRNHAIILEGAQWATNFKVFGAPFDSNTIYEFHKYWMSPVQGQIQEYVDFRDRYQVPIWLGESGENSDDWVRQFRTLLDQNNIGWCFWPYKKMPKASCLASIEPPEYWEEIVAFAKLPQDTGNSEKLIAARPPMDHCQKAVAGLLEKIQFNACHVNQGYLQALGAS